jgi:hypothetical protein
VGPQTPAGASQTAGAGLTKLSKLKKSAKNAEKLRFFHKRVVPKRFGSEQRWFGSEENWFGSEQRWFGSEENWFSSE